MVKQVQWLVQGLAGQFLMSLDSAHILPPGLRCSEIESTGESTLIENPFVEMVIRYLSTGQGGR